MFTVKVTYTTKGDSVTELIECDTPRVTHHRDGSVSVFIIGGRHDSWSFVINPQTESGEHTTEVYQIIVENAAGKTTEVFRAGGSLDDWRARRAAESLAAA